MENAELYTLSNKLPKRDALLSLEEYAPKIKWKKNYNKVMDIGSGDGSVTNMLQQYIPTPYFITGSDISKDMVDFANRHYGSDYMNFTELDIENKLPDTMKGQFDFVFSSYAFHWVNKQEQGFHNIYQMLAKGGDCLVIFLANMFVFDVYRELARNNKWSTWVYDVDRFISSYIDSKEPEKEIIPMMEKIGFVDIDVKCKSRKYMYDEDVMTNLIQAVNPFEIPEHLRGDFLKDYYEVLRRMNIVEKINGKYFPTAPFDYRLIVVYGSKPNV